jgi:hypothetical protein
MFDIFPSVTWISCFPSRSITPGGIECADGSSHSFY